MCGMHTVYLSGLATGSWVAAIWHPCRSLGPQRPGHLAAGGNNQGQLGDGTTGNANSKNVPTAVSGGLAFATIATGKHHGGSPGLDGTLGFHTCGVTTAGVAYCWGE